MTPLSIVVFIVIAGSGQIYYERKKRKVSHEIEKRQEKLLNKAQDIQARNS